MGVFVESSRQRDWGCKLKAKERSGTKLTKLSKWHQVDKVDNVAPSWHKSWQSGTGWHKNWLLEWHQVDTTLTLGKLKAVDQIRKQRLIWDGLTQSKVNIRKTDALKVDITKHAKLCLFCEILLPFVRRIAKTNQAFDGHKFLVSYLSFSFSQRFSYLANQNILNNSLWSPHIRCKKGGWSRQKMCKFWPQKKFEKMVSTKIVQIFPEKVWKDGLHSAARLCLFFLPGCKQPRSSCKTKESRFKT